MTCVLTSLYIQNVSTLQSCQFFFISAQLKIRTHSDQELTRVVVLLHWDSKKKYAGNGQQVPIERPYSKQMNVAFSGGGHTKAWREYLLLLQLLKQQNARIGSGTARIILRSFSRTSSDYGRWNLIPRKFEFVRQFRVKKGTTVMEAFQRKENQPSKEYRTSCI